MTLKAALTRFAKPKGKNAFFDRLDHRCSVLDVGCGNNSPLLFKNRFPNGRYTGIDVSDYRHSATIVADEYILTSPEQFSSTIARFRDEFDAVISSHNLEHCIDRSATLNAMAGAIKPGGRLYLSFPSEASVNFPSREGTLNYFDDDTHLDLPPRMNEILDILREAGLHAEFAAPRYRPMILAALGAISEPLSRRQRRVRVGTWELYGFEAIIWAQKPEMR